MELSDQSLVELLDHKHVAIRTAALESLAASFADSPNVLPKVFEAWDRFGIAEAYPEFALLSHLPVSEQWCDVSIKRASQMVAGRKLTELECRFAGKLIEAYSVALPTAYQACLSELSKLKSESKIFFRVDTEAMCQRAGMMRLSNEQLIEIISIPQNAEVSNDIMRGVKSALDELHSRGVAEHYWHKAINEIEAETATAQPLTQASLEVMSRRGAAGFEYELAKLLGHRDAMIADAIAITLSRCRNMAALDAISQSFSQMSGQAKLRAAIVLQRMRLPGVASRIRLLREMNNSDRNVDEALRVAELLQFDFDYLEDWLESLMVIDDRTLHRVTSRLPLILPLSEHLDKADAGRLLKLVQSRGTNL